MDTGATDPSGADPESGSAPAVELRNITKRYGSVIACDGVDLVAPTRPDPRHPRRERRRQVDADEDADRARPARRGVDPHRRRTGSRSTARSPRRRSASAWCTSTSASSTRSTVWENVALGEAGRLDPTAIRNRIGEIADHYGLVIEPDARVGDLTAGLRQRVEIIKCLRRDPTIVIFDEPTSVLTPEESVQLFASLRQVVAAEGRAVVLVSHKLDEVLHATDDISIMRQGRVVDRLLASEADAPTLARGMVGREVSLRSESAALGVLVVDEEDARDGVEASRIAPSLPPTVASRCSGSIAATRARGSVGCSALDDLSLELRAGEIVGVAGVEGNGQRELGDLLSSLVALESGVVEIDGERIADRSLGSDGSGGYRCDPRGSARQRHRARHDRSPRTSCSSTSRRSPRRGVIDQSALDDLATQMIDQFGIHCSGPDAPMWSLSGGNQQRVVLARELGSTPEGAGRRPTDAGSRCRAPSST